MKVLIKKNLVISIAILLFFVPVVAFAEDSNFLPNVMVGQLTVERLDMTGSTNQYYGGLGGNEAVINWQSDYYTFGFDKEASTGCAGFGNIIDKIPCFILKANPIHYSGTLGLMTSKTYGDNIMKLQTAALIYPRNTILGDVYTLTNVLPTFDQFGQHLYQSGRSSFHPAGAFYRMSHYRFNPNAQAYWDSGDNNKNAKMTETILRLKRDAKELKSVGVVNNQGEVYPDKTNPFDGVCGDKSYTISYNCPEINQYPEGRVWHNSYQAPLGSTRASLMASNLLAYRKKSTMILEGGDVYLTGSVEKENADSSLGMIVLPNSSGSYGNVYIDNRGNTNQMTIEASIFAPGGTIYLQGDNIRLIGSFVAQNFETLGESGAPANQRIIQDTRGSELWPPGFRDLLPLSRISN